MKPGIEYWSCEKTGSEFFIKVEELLPSGNKIRNAVVVNELELKYANFDLSQFKIEVLAREFRDYRARVMGVVS